ncbi:hypothetical protein SAMN04488065_2246 [Haloplanus vescus]|uniref:DUF8107 domain-containing protein n=1 Tax=Haloplanus vescus TaxID=555874 RepID=A0A1H3ZB37_9EURY|nr:hypothetical protein [Haloplanus vescus]SEA20571.1 hypothetical protein SAMN04488065_2246 [Haloplanus vescus]
MASQGDPRVLFVMNLVLSTLFAAGVVWGLSFIGLLGLTVWNVTALALLLMALTYVVTMR